MVSAYAKSGYVSGADVNHPDCAHNNYCHDFGSILNFIEYAFGTGGNSLGTIGNVSYPYADALVQDASSPPPNNYSLYDFFDFSQSARQFTPITAWKYPPDCFHHPGHPNCFPAYPADPDNDANEN